MHTALRAAGVLLTGGLIVLPGPWGPALTGLRPGEPGPAVLGGDAGRGEAIYLELDCIRCHSVPQTHEGTNTPANLRIAGSRSPAAWLFEYLRDPYPMRFSSEGVRPRRRMPAYPLAPGDLADLVAFLAVQVDSGVVPARPGLEEALGDSARVAEGRTLFGEYQCSGCHRLAGEGNLVGPALDEVGMRRTPEYVTALLEDPDRVVPGTAMEDKDLWDEEIVSLTAYLMTLTEPPSRY